MRRVPAAVFAVLILTLGVAFTVDARPAGAATKSGELYTCLVEAFTKVAGENGGEPTPESIEKLSDSQKQELDVEAQRCYSSPSPVLPATSELIWGGLAFVIVAIGLIKFGFPAIRKTLAARSDAIRRDLEGAEAAKAEAEAEKAAYAAKISEARTEATRIVEEARQTADGVRAETVKRAEEEANAIRARANEDAQAAAARAMSDLQSQVGAISIELAEKIVEQNIDASAQQQLIESFISQVGRN